MNRTLQRSTSYRSIGAERRSETVLGLCLLVIVGCVDTASVRNDSRADGGNGGAGSGMGGRESGAAGGAAGTAGSTPRTVGSARAGAGAGGIGSAGMEAPTPRGGASAPTVDAGEDDAGADDGPVGGPSSAPSAGSGGTEAPVAGAAGVEGMPSVGPDPSLVKGSAKNCSSYAEPQNGKCGGWYCSVDLATLTRAVDPAARCGAAVDVLCSNATSAAVGRCARDLKSRMIGATNAQLRPLVQDCVYENPEFKQKVTPECLNCSITGAECIGDACLLECLAGDSAACDRCRLENGCDQAAVACGQLPTPF